MDEKHVFFIDEMPWLDTHKSGFLPAFEYFWNDYGSSKDNLVFVICGSATSWMVDNLANNKGGLFDRQTCRLYLEPFTLAQTREYLLFMVTKRKQLYISHLITIQIFILDF